MVKGGSIGVILEVDVQNGGKMSAFQLSTCFEMRVLFLTPLYI